MPAPAMLPGIRVVSARSTPEAVLPRMDIAVFAGFASTGPLHFPVVVESVAQFRTVFGEDLTLAWDAGRGEPVTAHLGAAVTAFFANGGRRCWIIRLARTAALEALWRDTPETMLPPDDLIVASRFPMPGVLATFADGTGAAAATASARAAGSWADSVLVSTAITAAGFDIASWQPLGPTAPLSARIVPGVPLQPGDLLQLDGTDIRYARVDSASLGQAQITVLAAFAPLGAMAANAGSAFIAGVTTAPLPATLQADAIRARVTFDAPAAAGAEPGHWVRWSDGSGNPVWLRADAIDASRAASDPARFSLAVSGVAWREEPVALPGNPPLHAFRLALDLRAANGADSQRVSGLGLTPVAGGSWWETLDDDGYYRAGGDPVDRFALAAAETIAQAPAAWLPLGVTGLDGSACVPFPQSATALERDGLSRYDSELFLDPDLAGLGIDTLAATADQIRFTAEPTRALFGIHAAFGIGNAGLFDEPSLFAAPDALHAGWKRAAAPAQPPIPSTASPSANDASRFVPCARLVLTPPVLTGPDGPVARGTFRLQWTEAAPGVSGVLLESPDASFALTRSLPDDGTRTVDVTADRTGVFFYRVDAAAGGASVTSNVLSVTVWDTAWVALSPTEYAPRGEAELIRIQRAALQFAASSGEIFAVLGLPRHVRGPDLARLASGLIAAIGYAEQRALTFGALYHPWLMNSALRPTPPDGAATGVLAARASLRGAWIAPANERLRDVVALLPAPDSAALLDALQNHVNLLTSAPRGFLALSATTLSDEPGLDAINVRRLLSLLRRVALRQGVNYVFEPLGDTLRRSVERSFTLLMSDLFRRGAFAGATEAGSFAVVTGEGVTTQADLDDGRLIVELRVAPSLPLQFLTVTLVQTGERLSVSEQA